jgi:N-acetylneuraminate synthase/sialic acid synthase
MNAIDTATRASVSTIEPFDIEGRPVGDDQPCYVIAEIGNNHQGRADLCRDLIRAAKDAGADAVKLQKRCNTALYTSDYMNAPYSGPNAFGPTYGLHRNAIELEAEDFRAMRDFAGELGITFFATPFDEPSLRLLSDLDVPAFKIASGDVTNLPFIEKIAALGKPVILSTGAATLAQVGNAVGVLREASVPRAVLHCTASYPAGDDDVNLNIISDYRRRLADCVIGFSSHDLGVELSLCAIAMGARIVEKHFTLDRSMKGTDHALSLDPEGMAQLTGGARRLHRALGDGRKRVLPSERAALVKMGKKLVAARDLRAGTVLHADDLVARSPGDGIAPDSIGDFVGRPLAADLHRDEAIRLEHVDRGCQ